MASKTLGRMHYYIIQCIATVAEPHMWLISYVPHQNQAFLQEYYSRRALKETRQELIMFACKRQRTLVDSRDCDQSWRSKGSDFWVDVVNTEPLDIRSFHSMHCKPDLNILFKPQLTFRLVHFPLNRRWKAMVQSLHRNFAFAIVKQCRLLQPSMPA